MTRITYPPSYFEPPEIPWEQRAAEWVQDDDERLCAALMREYDAESMAYYIIGVWHWLGSLTARGERAQGALDDLNEMVERATAAEVSRLKGDGDDFDEKD